LKVYWDKRKRPIIHGIGAAVCCAVFFFSDLFASEGANERGLVFGDVLMVDMQW
jgi:hypothetical protein